MARQACGRYADDLSAFTDHTLPKRRWEEVAYHVAGCDGCRSAVHDLRGISSALSGIRADDAAAPDSLTARLEGIAEHRDTPLYMAADAPAVLPTKRSARRHGVKLGSAVALTALASLFLIGFILAPQPPVVRDAVAKARTAHLQAVSALQPQEGLHEVVPASVETASLVSSAPLTSPPPAELCDGVGCPATLAGLPLVAHQREGQTGIRLVYSDGSHVVTLCWRLGVLRDDGRGVVFEAGDAAAPAVAAWQSGRGVVMVATDGSAELLQSAVAELPEWSGHEMPLFERIQRGWMRLAGIN